jgi:pimeloyl-ACP methyl ester carboxylesterase
MNESPTTAQIVPVNGMEMYCETYGEGEPLVLLHGFNGIGEHWKLVFPEMPRGYRAIAPDLRGHGRSTNPSRKFTFRQSAADVLALLDALHVDHFQAIGMSAGAKTLLHVATQQPSRVEAMVLVSAAPYFPHQARAAMAQISIDNHSEEEWKVMRNRHKHGDDQIWALWEQGNAMKDSFDDMNFTPPLLSTTTARTLIVHGDRDPFYPVSLALEMCAAIPKSYLWIVPNGGHGPIFGTMARPFVETALAFLRGEWESR